ncbi:hypothetical protein [Micromonospora sp. NPDC023814]|uniref:hypothetical protein n=1 Tax=Micromonospora sp. NPDC023814 TaxID=3154596 RepID=UPI0033FE2FCC
MADDDAASAAEPAGPPPAPDDHVRALLRMPASEPVRPADRLAADVLAAAATGNASALLATPAQILALAESLHPPATEATTESPSAAAIAMRGWLVRRSRGVAGLAVRLYGPRLWPTADGLRIVRRLYDVLEAGRLTPDRAGLATLATRVLGIDEAEYTDRDHGQRLLELVHQATSPGTAVTEPAVHQAGVASQAMRHLAGHLPLTVPEQQRLLVELLTPRPRERDQFLAVAMLLNADDVTLAALLASADVRAAVLDRVRLPVVRPVLERVVDARVEGGMAALVSAADRGGVVATHGQPAGRFTPDMLTDHGPDTRYNTLFALPGVEKLKAFRFVLARQLEGAPPVAWRTHEQLREDAMLLRLMHEVTNRFADLGGTAMVRAVVDLPSLAAVEAAEAAMSREPARPAEALREFQEILPSHPEPYGVRLWDELEATRTGRVANRLRGRRPEDRVPGRLLGWDRVNQIINEARESNNITFAPYSRLEIPYVGGTGSPDDTILDPWEYFEPKMQTDDGIRELAMNAIREHIHTLDVNREHGARLDLLTFSNRESQIALEVITAQLDDPVRRLQWAEAMRNWSGLALQGRAILVDRWLPDRDEERLNMAVELFQVGMHEDVHFREHAGHRSFGEAFSWHTGSGRAWLEGVPTALHEMSWWLLYYDWGRWQRVLATVGGPYAPSRPYPAPRINRLRYDEYVNALRLIHLIGAENLMALYFLGDTERFVSSFAVAMLGSPKAPLSVRAVREAIGQLGSAPPPAREALDDQVFLDPQEAEAVEEAAVIGLERLATGRAGQGVTVASLTSAGAAWVGRLRLTDDRYARPVSALGRQVRAFHPGGVYGALVGSAELVSGVVGMPPVAVVPTVDGDAGGWLDVGRWEVSVRAGVSWAAAWEDLFGGLVRAEAFWRVAAGDRMPWPWSAGALTFVLGRLAGRSAVVGQWPGWRRELWADLFGAGDRSVLDRVADEVVRGARGGESVGGLQGVLTPVEAFESVVEGADERRAFGWRAGYRRFVEVDPDTGVRLGEFELVSGRWVPRFALLGGAPESGSSSSATPALVERFVTRYQDLVGTTLPELRLSPDRVRALVGEVSGLAEGGPVLDLVDDVLGNDEIAGALGDLRTWWSSRSAVIVPEVRDRVAAFIGDVLVAASVLPARERVVAEGGSVWEVVAPVSPALVVRVLHQMVTSGAFVFYDASEPMLVRWAQLGLLNLSPGLRTRVAVHPLFERLMARPDLLREQLFLAGRGPAWPIHVPTVVAALVVGRAMADQAAASGVDVAPVPTRLGQVERSVESALASVGPEAAAVLRAAADEVAVTVDPAWPHDGMFVLPPGEIGSVLPWLADYVTVGWLWDLAVYEGGLWLHTRTGVPAVLLRAERAGGRRRFVAALGPERAAARLGFAEVAPFLAWHDASQMWLRGQAWQTTHLTDRAIVEVVARYRAGDPAVLLTVQGKAWLISSMRGAGYAAAAVVGLVQFSDDQELAQLWSVPAVREVLREVAQHPEAGPWLAEVLAGRFEGGVAALDAADAVVRGMPPRVFDPERMAAALAGIRPEEFFAPTVPAAIAEFLEMPLRHRALAARWLSSHVRLLFSPDPDPDPDQRPAPVNPDVLRVALYLLYRDVVQYAPPAELMAALSVPPSPGRRDALVYALAPVSRRSQAGSAGSAGSRSTDEQYRQQLRSAFDELLALLTALLAGRGEAEHGALSEPFTLSHFERIAHLAAEQIDRVFGRLARAPRLVADRPGEPGTLRDEFVERGAWLSVIGEASRRSLALRQLRYLLSAQPSLRKVSSEHGESAGFDVRGRPTNPAGRIAAEVMDEIVADPDRVDQILKIWRSWGGSHLDGMVFVQLFPLGPTERDQQRTLTKAAATFVHELFHKMEHPGYVRYRDTFGPGTAEYNSLVEGVVSLFTRMVWHGFVPFLAEREVLDPRHPRMIIEERFASGEPLDPVTLVAMAADYPSIVEARRLAELVGGVNNLTVAFFRGRVDLMMSRATVVLLGSPVNPLTTAELGSAVDRLADLSPAQRDSLFVSAYLDGVGEDDLAPLLSRPEAAMVSVITRDQPEGEVPVAQAASLEPRIVELDDTDVPPDLGQLVSGARPVEPREAADAGPTVRSGTDDRGYAYTHFPGGVAAYAADGLSAASLAALSAPGTFTVVVGLNRGGRPVLARHDATVDATPQAVRAFLHRHAPEEAGRLSVRLVSPEGTMSRLLNDLTGHVNGLLTTTGAATVRPSAMDAGDGMSSLSPAAAAEAARLTASGRLAGWSLGRIVNSPPVFGARNAELNVPGLLAPGGLTGVSLHPETGVVTGEFYRESDRHPWVLRLHGGASSSSDVDMRDRSDFDVEPAEDEVVGAETAGSRRQRADPGDAAGPGPSLRRQRRVGPDHGAVPVDQIDEEAWLLPPPPRVGLADGDDIRRPLVRSPRATVERLTAQAARTAKGFSDQRGLVRELVTGRAPAQAPSSAAVDPDSVGFVAVVFGPSRVVRRPDSADRSPVELVRMYREAMGGRLGGMRLVIGINRWNDPASSLLTARLEEQLREEVADEQAAVDALLGDEAGAVTVLGHVLDLPVFDVDEDGGEGSVVDADFWRHGRAVGSGPQGWMLRYRLNFPHAGVQQAIVGSLTFLGYLRELRASHGEVFVHFGDSDVVSLVNPRGGNTRSVFDRYIEEIRASRAGGRHSPLVRLGGAIAYSETEIDGPNHVGEPSFEAKLTVLLAETHQLWSAVLAQGVYPMAYFIEPNTAVNTRYLGQLRRPDGAVVDGLLGSMSQRVAQQMSGFASTYGMHRRLHQLGLDSQEVSRFLADPAAQVVTSVRGEKRTYREQHVWMVATPTEDGGWRANRPGRTLFTLGALPRSSNFAFTPGRLVGKLGSLVGLGSPNLVANLLDPLNRPNALLELDEQAVVETREKLLRYSQLTSRLESLLATGLDRPLDDLIEDLGRYHDEPLPDWYQRETGLASVLDELADAFAQIGLAPSTSGEGPEEPTRSGPSPRAAAGPAHADLGDGFDADDETIPYDDDDALGDPDDEDAAGPYPADSYSADSDSESEGSDDAVDARQVLAVNPRRRAPIVRSAFGAGVPDRLLAGTYEVALESSGLFTFANRDFVLSRRLSRSQPLDAHVTPSGWFIVTHRVTAEPVVAGWVPGTWAVDEPWLRVGDQVDIAVWGTGERQRHVARRIARPSRAFGNWVWLPEGMDEATVRFNPEGRQAVIDGDGVVRAVDFVAKREDPNVLVVHPAYRVMVSLGGTLVHGGTAGVRFYVGGEHVGSYATIETVDRNGEPWVTVTADGGAVLLDRRLDGLRTAAAPQPDEAVPTVPSDVVVVRTAPVSGSEVDTGAGWLPVGSRFDGLDVGVWDDGQDGLWYFHPETRVVLAMASASEPITLVRPSTRSAWAGPGQRILHTSRKQRSVDIAKMAIEIPSHLPRAPVTVDVDRRGRFVVTHPESPERIAQGWMPHAPGAPDAGQWLRPGLVAGAARLDEPERTLETIGMPEIRIERVKVSIPRSAPPAVRLRYSPRHGQVAVIDPDSGRVIGVRHTVRLDAPHTDSRTVILLATSGVQVYLTRAPLVNNLYQVHFDGRDHAFPIGLSKVAADASYTSDGWFRLSHPVTGRTIASGRMSWAPLTSAERGDFLPWPTVGEPPPPLQADDTEHTRAGASYMMVDGVRVYVPSGIPQVVVRISRSRGLVLVLDPAKERVLSWRRITRFDEPAVSVPVHPPFAARVNEWGTVGHPDPVIGRIYVGLNPDGTRRTGMTVVVESTADGWVRVSDGRGQELVARRYEGLASRAALIDGEQAPTVPDDVEFRHARVNPSGVVAGRGGRVVSAIGGDRGEVGAYDDGRGVHYFDLQSRVVGAFEPATGASYEAAPRPRYHGGHSVDVRKPAGRYVVSARRDQPNRRMTFLGAIFWMPVHLPIGSLDVSVRENGWIVLTDVRTSELAGSAWSAGTLSDAIWLEVGDIAGPTRDPERQVRSDKSRTREHVFNRSVGRPAQPSSVILRYQPELGKIAVIDPSNMLVLRSFDVVRDDPRDFRVHDPFELRVSRGGTISHPHVPAVRLFVDLDDEIVGSADPFVTLCTDADGWVTVTRGGTVLVRRRLSSLLDRVVSADDHPPRVPEGVRHTTVTVGEDGYVTEDGALAPLSVGHHYRDIEIGLWVDDRGRATYFHLDTRVILTRRGPEPSPPDDTAGVAARGGSVKRGGTAGRGAPVKRGGTAGRGSSRQVTRRPVPKQGASGPASAALDAPPGPAARAVAAAESEGLAADRRFAGWIKGVIADPQQVVGARWRPLGLPGLLAPDGLSAVSLHPETGVVTGAWYRADKQHPWIPRLRGGATPSDGATGQLPDVSGMPSATDSVPRSRNPEVVRWAWQIARSVRFGASSRSAALAETGEWIAGLLRIPPVRVAPAADGVGGFDAASATVWLPTAPAWRDLWTSLLAGMAQAEAWHRSQSIMDADQARRLGDAMAAEANSKPSEPLASLLGTITVESDVDGKSVRGEVPGWFTRTDRFTQVDPERIVKVAEWKRRDPATGWSPAGLRGGLIGTEVKAVGVAIPDGQQRPPKKTNLAHLPGLVSLVSGYVRGDRAELVGVPASLYDDEVRGADPETSQAVMEALIGRLRESFGEQTVAGLMPMMTAEPEHAGLVIKRYPDDTLDFFITAGDRPETLYRLFTDLAQHPRVKVTQWSDMIDLAMDIGERVAGKLDGSEEPSLPDFGSGETVAGHVAMLFMIFAAHVAHHDPDESGKWFTWAPRATPGEAFAALPAQLRLGLEVYRAWIQREFVDAYQEDFPERVNDIEIARRGAVNLLHAPLPGRDYTVAQAIAGGFTPDPPRTVTPDEAFGITGVGVDDLKLIAGEYRILRDVSESGQRAVTQAWVRRSSRARYRQFTATRRITGAVFAEPVDLDDLARTFRRRADAVRVDPDATDGAAKDLLIRMYEGSASLVSGLSHDPSRLDLRGLHAALAALTGPEYDQVLHGAVESVHIDLDSRTRAGVEVVDVTAVGLSQKDRAAADFGEWWPNARVLATDGERAAVRFVRTADKYTGANSAPRWVDLERLDARLADPTGDLGGMERLRAALKIAPEVGADVAAQTVRDVAYLTGAAYGPDFEVVNLVAVDRLARVSAEGSGRPALLWTELEDIVRRVRGDVVSRYGAPRAVDPGQVRILADILAGLDHDVTFDELYSLAWDTPVREWVSPMDEFTAGDDPARLPRIFARVRTIAGANGVWHLVHQVGAPWATAREFWDTAHLTFEAVGDEFENADLVAVHRLRAYAVNQGLGQWRDIESLLTVLLNEPARFSTSDPRFFTGPAVRHLVAVVRELGPDELTMENLYWQIAGAEPRPAARPLADLRRARLAERHRGDVSDEEVTGADSAPRRVDFRSLDQRLQSLAAMNHGLPGLAGLIGLRNTSQWRQALWDVAYLAEVMGVGLTVESLRAVRRYAHLAWSPDTNHWARSWRELKHTAGQVRLPARPEADPGWVRVVFDIVTSLDGEQPTSHDVVNVIVQSFDLTLVTIWPGSPDVLTAPADRVSMPQILARLRQVAEPDGVAALMAEVSGPPPVRPMEQHWDIAHLTAHATVVPFTRADLTTMARLAFPQGTAPHVVGWPRITSLVRGLVGDPDLAVSREHLRWLFEIARGLDPEAAEQNLRRQVARIEAPRGGGARALADLRRAALARRYSDQLEDLREHLARARTDSRMRRLVRPTGPPLDPETVLDVIEVHEAVSPDQPFSVETGQDIRRLLWVRGEARPMRSVHHLVELADELRAGRPRPDQPGADVADVKSLINAMRRAKEHVRFGPVAEAHLARHWEPVVAPASPTPTEPGLSLRGGAAPPIGQDPALGKSLGDQLRTVLGSRRLLAGTHAVTQFSDGSIPVVADEATRSPLFRDEGVELFGPDPVEAARVADLIETGAGSVAPRDQAAYDAARPGPGSGPDLAEVSDLGGLGRVDVMRNLVVESVSERSSGGLPGWFGELRVSDPEVVRWLWVVGRAVRSGVGGVWVALEEVARWGSGLLGVTGVAVGAAVGGVGGFDAGGWRVLVPVGLSWRESWSWLVAGLVEAEVWYRGVLRLGVLSWPVGRDVVVAAVGRVGRGGGWALGWDPVSEDGRRQLRGVVEAVLGSDVSRAPVRSLAGLLSTIEVASDGGSGRVRAVGFFTGRDRFVEVDPGALVLRPGFFRVGPGQPWRGRVVGGRAGAQVRDVIEWVPRSGAGDGVGPATAVEGGGVMRAGRGGLRAAVVGGRRAVSAWTSDRGSWPGRVGLRRYDSAIERAYLAATDNVGRRSVLIDALPGLTHVAMHALAGFAADNAHTDGDRADVEVLRLLAFALSPSYVAGGEPDWIAGLDAVGRYEWSSAVFALHRKLPRSRDALKPLMQTLVRCAPVSS